MSFANVRFKNLHTYVTYCCNNEKFGPCVTFCGIKVKMFDSSTLVYICIHSSSDSSSDSSTLVYIRLVTRLQSSKFVYDTSTFVCRRLVTRLCF